MSGDTIILDGTTVEELERYHVTTLRVVLDVNADVAAHKREERARAEREAEAARQHEASVREIADRVSFEYRCGYRSRSGSA